MNSCNRSILHIYRASGGSDSKELACKAGDPDLIPGWERSPGDGIGNSLQYSCLENSMDRGAWYSPWGHNELDTAEQVHVLSFFSLQRQEFLCCLVTNVIYDSFVIPWTIGCQAPLSMEFSRQEYWGGLPFPSPEDLSNAGIKPGSPTLQADSVLSELLERKTNF